MCLYFIGSNDTYPFIFVGNRDENYDRLTVKAHFWNDTLLAGKDQQMGGTWLGITTNGRFAAITNSILKQQDYNTNYNSRGDIVVNYLNSTDDAYAYIIALINNNIEYKGYNLIVGEINKDFWYYSNVLKQSKPIRLNINDIHGIANHSLDYPWPRLVTAKKNIYDVLKSNKVTFDICEELFKIMCNDTNLINDDSVNNDVLQSKIFIKESSFGTRLTTIILIDKDMNVKFIERTYDNSNVIDNVVSDTVHQFKIINKIIG